MEMEAVKQEHASIESQLVSLNKQIDDLASEVESHKAKVIFADILHTTEKLLAKLNTLTFICFPS